MGERSKVVPRSSRNPGGPGLCMCSRGKRICPFVPLLETVQEEEEEDDTRVRDHVPARAVNAITRASNKSVIVRGRRYRSCSMNGNGLVSLVRGGLKTTRPGSSPSFSSEKKEREKKRRARSNRTNLRLLIKRI